MKEGISSAASSCCEPNDLVSQKSGILLWRLPVAAVIVGSSWPSIRSWLWIPRFSDHGRRVPCEREAVWKTALLFHWPALRVLGGLRRTCAGERCTTSPGTFLLIVFTTATFACLAELPLGRYREQGIKPGKSAEIHDLPAQASPTTANSSETRT